MAENSCDKWNERRHLKPTPRPICLESLNEKCPDVKSPEDIQREKNIVKAILKPVVPTRRVIDPKVLACPWPAKKPKCCNLRGAENAEHTNNFCSPKCAPSRALLHLEEVFKLYFLSICTFTKFFSNSGRNVLFKSQHISTVSI